MKEPRADRLPPAIAQESGLSNRALAGWRRDLPGSDQRHPHQIEEPPTVPSPAAGPPFVLTFLAPAGTVRCAAHMGCQSAPKEPELFRLESGRECGDSPDLRQFATSILQLQCRRRGPSWAGSGTRAPQICDVHHSLLIAGRITSLKGSGRNLAYDRDPGRKRLYAGTRQNSP
jgi:hypothetical protein